MSTVERGPSSVTLQQFMSACTAMQPHINTRLVVLSMADQAASAVTMQQCSCKQGCYRFFGQVPQSAGYTVCSVIWYCLFIICTCLVSWRKYFSLCTFSYQPISITHFVPSFLFLLSPIFLYASFYFSFLT